MTAGNMPAVRRPVVLIGMRGVGKSTAGRLLAERIGGTFLDVDAMVADRASCSIAEIFATRGELAFREWEKSALAEIEGRPPSVLAVGGGAVTLRENVDRLRRMGTVVWLQAPPEVLARRVAEDPATPMNRPPLLGRSAVDELAESLRRREAAYASAADVTLDVSAKTPAEVVSAILERCQGASPRDEFAS